MRVDSDNEPDSDDASHALRCVDHLVYATPNLQATVEDLERRLGVRASPGGQHPGRGTRNAILALGETCYLEILGPDESQAPSPQPRWFSIDRLQGPKLVAWAVKSSNLEDIRARASAFGVRLGEVVAGSRKRADGTLLSWRYTDPIDVVADGIVPFFIDWGDTRHPAQGAASGARLVDLQLMHPDAQSVQRALNQLDIRLAVHPASASSLVATIDSLAGRLRLS